VTLLRTVLARIGAVLIGRRRDLFDPDSPPDRLLLLRFQQLLRDLLEPPPPEKGHTPPAWLVREQEQLPSVSIDVTWIIPTLEGYLRGLAMEVQREIARRGGKERGALTFVVHRFAQAHRLTTKEEESLRVMLHAYLREQRAGPEV
jgi:hypothetical protein